MPRCRVCKSSFERVRPMQVVCQDMRCILGHVEAQKARKLERQAMQSRKEFRERKEAAKTLGELRADAQRAFNAFIRARDEKSGYHCICCGKPFEPQRPGGSIDAGHYLSRGSHPNLAFSEVNVNAQRKSCNRPGGTTAAAFRIGMINRYGIEQVEALEADNEPRRFRAEDYREITAHYKMKLKKLRESMK